METKRQTARAASRTAMDSDELWAKIDTMGKDQIIALLEGKDDEAERLRAYVDQLTSVVIDKAPQLLGELNSSASKVTSHLCSCYQPLCSAAIAC